MLIYEKNNKLNINFENELDNPDIEIGKGEINVDGNNIVSGGGSGQTLIVNADYDNTGMLNKTWSEIDNALSTGNRVIMINADRDGHNVFPCFFTAYHDGNSTDPATESYYFVNFYDFSSSNVRKLTFKCSTIDDYPIFSK